jgi:GH15 family glucan-1,4-alpha-glucosidase
MQNSERAPYRPIGDYAVIGDMHTAALIGTNGSLDWCCFPRFDSSAVFCKLLDHEKGGEFRIEPYGKYTCSRSYVGATNVLSLVFSVSTGQFRVTDFMPLRSARDGRREEADTSPRIVRRIEGISGECEVEVVFRPTFDFARAETCIEMLPGRLLAYSADEALSLESALPFELLAFNRARAPVKVTAGQRLDLYLRYGKQVRENDNVRPDIEQLHKEALHFWKAWAEKCTY